MIDPLYKEVLVAAGFVMRPFEAPDSQFPTRSLGLYRGSTCYARGYTEESLWMRTPPLSTIISRLVAAMVNEVEEAEFVARPATKDGVQGWWVAVQKYNEDWDDWGIHTHTHSADPILDNAVARLFLVFIKEHPIDMTNIEFP